MASTLPSSSAALAASDAKKAGHGPPKPVVAAYTLFAGLAFAVYHFVADGEFSAIVTMAVMLQCLAMLLLCLQALASGSASGISAHSLGLEALALCCRLSSTTWLNGYLPMDASGDWVYQAFDACTLLLVLGLLYRVLTTHAVTYNPEADSLPCLPIIAASFLLAALLHADMNRRPFFDAMWMAGLFIGVLAVLPQLWLISRTGGRVQPLTSHFIALMALSRVLSGIFMWYARHDIACVEWIEGFNHSSPAILGAHFVHLVLLGDFAYYYVKGVAKSGLGATLQVASEMIIV